MNYRRSHILLLSLLLPLSVGGCSVRRMAVGAVADALSGEGAGAFQMDDDPELVGEALPFSLKLMESILREAPEHRGLLVATASGFVQYSHGWVLRPAERLEASDLPKAREGRARANRLFLRALGYGRRALEVGRPGFASELFREPERAVTRLEREDVPAMYWTAAALGSAIGTAKDDMAMVADLPVVAALAGRALQLDEAWGDGALHELAITLENGRPDGPESGVVAAEQHFQRAEVLAEGRGISHLVSMAETICVRTQDRARFQALLERALAFDVDTCPETRLANLLAQERARWLIGRIDELFF
jgi:predicted anti-sigma-YlaC factor YlaD